MKIAVSGSGRAAVQEISQKAKQLGREIAKDQHIVLTGGCHGYPYAALRGALLQGGRIIVYSPAKDEQEHIGRYGFSIDPDVEYEFTGLGIPERNIPLIYAADAVIFFDGKVGTLNEFTLALHEKKKIAVLKSGPLTELFQKIAQICQRRDIIYSDDPCKIVKFL